MVCVTDQGVTPFTARPIAANVARSYAPPSKRLLCPQPASVTSSEDAAGGDAQLAPRSSTVAASTGLVAAAGDDAEEAASPRLSISTSATPCAYGTISTGGGGVGERGECGPPDSMSI